MAVEIKRWDKKEGKYIVKTYETVAERLRKFRTECSIEDGWALHSQVKADSDTVFVTSWIVDPESRTVAVGHAEENRNANQINKTSAVENAETSAIGRALMSAGYGGGEFATAEELQVALQNRAEVDAVTLNDQDGSKRQSGQEKQSGDLPQVSGVKFSEKQGNDGQLYMLAEGDTYNKKSILEKYGFKTRKDAQGNWVTFRPSNTKKAA